MAASKASKRAQLNQEKLLRPLGLYEQDFENEVQKVQKICQEVQDVKETMARKMLQWYSSLTIQCAYRRHVAYLQLYAKKAARLLLSFVRFKLYFRKRQLAKRKIMRAYRSHRKWRAFRAVMRLHRAARVIQRLFRAMKNRQAIADKLELMVFVKRCLSHYELFGERRALRAIKMRQDPDYYVRMNHPINRLTRAFARKKRLRILMGPQGKLAFYVLAHYFDGHKDGKRNMVIEFVRRKVTANTSTRDPGSPSAPRHSFTPAMGSPTATREDISDTSDSSDLLGSDQAPLSITAAVSAAAGIFSPTSGRSGSYHSSSASAADAGSPTSNSSPKNSPVRNANVTRLSAGSTNNTTVDNTNSNASSPLRSPLGSNAGAASPRRGRAAQISFAAGTTGGSLVSSSNFSEKDLPAILKGRHRLRGMADAVILLFDLIKVAKQNPSVLEDHLAPNKNLYGTARRSHHHHKQIISENTAQSAPSNSSNNSSSNSSSNNHANSSSTSKNSASTGFSSQQRSTKTNNNASLSGRIQASMLAKGKDTNISQATTRTTQRRVSMVIPAALMQQAQMASITESAVAPTDTNVASTLTVQPTEAKTDDSSVRQLPQRRPSLESKPPGQVPTNNRSAGAPPSTLTKGKSPRTIKILQQSNKSKDSMITSSRSTDENSSIAEKLSIDPTSALSAQGSRPSSASSNVSDLGMSTRSTTPVPPPTTSQDPLLLKQSSNESLQSAASADVSDSSSTFAAQSPITDSSSKLRDDGKHSVFGTTSAAANRSSFMAIASLLASASAGTVSPYQKAHSAAVSSPPCIDSVSSTHTHPGASGAGRSPALSMTMSSQSDISISSPFQHLQRHTPSQQQHQETDSQLHNPYNSTSSFLSTQPSLLMSTVGHGETIGSMLLSASNSAASLNFDLPDETMESLLSAKLDDDVAHQGDQQLLATIVPTDGSPPKLTLQLSTASLDLDIPDEDMDALLQMYTSPYQSIVYENSLDPVAEIAPVIGKEDERASRTSAQTTRQLALSTVSRQSSSSSLDLDIPIEEEALLLNEALLPNADSSLANLLHNATLEDSLSTSHFTL